MDNLAGQILGLPQDVRSGSMCFFGCWHGRPLDNYESFTSVNFEDNKLVMVYGDRVIVEIWDPRVLEVEGITLSIAEASRVKRTWHPTNVEPRSDNALFYDFRVDGDSVRVHSSFGDGLKPSLAEPAFRIV